MTSFVTATAFDWVSHDSPSPSDIGKPLFSQAQIFASFFTKIINLELISGAGKPLFILRRVDFPRTAVKVPFATTEFPSKIWNDQVPSAIFTTVSSPERVFSMEAGSNIFIEHESPKLEITFTEAGSI